MRSQLIKLACREVRILRFDQFWSDLVSSYLGVMLSVAQHCSSITVLLV